MIPEFPQFKKLELSDKDDVEKYSSKFPPYSDFNFVSLWSWNIIDEMRLSTLNDNLIIHFTDYLTGKLFYSFLGNNKVNETADTLLELSKKDGLKIELKLIPEDSLTGLDLNKFKAEEDEDNFDYIYSILELKDMAGGKFSKKRNQVANFSANYADAEAKTIDLKDKSIQDRIMAIFQEWLEMKIEEDANFVTNEVVAMKRLLSAAESFDLVCVGIFVEEKLAAFLVNELIEGNYVVAHASKTDKNMVGINSFLMQENAEILFSLGKEFFNYEQDLGVASLRDAKTRFRPTKFLKKYKLAYL